MNTLQHFCQFQLCGKLLSQHRKWEIEDKIQD